MTTEYEALDLSEMQSEYERVTAEPGAPQQGEYLKNFVRLPERDGYVHLRLLPRKKGGKFYCATRVHTLFNPTTKQKKLEYEKYWVHQDRTSCSYSSPSSRH